MPVLSVREGRAKWGQPGRAARRDSTHYTLPLGSMTRRLGGQGARGVQPAGQRGRQRCQRFGLADGIGGKARYPTVSVVPAGGCKPVEAGQRLQRFTTPAPRPLIPARRSLTMQAPLPGGAGAAVSADGRLSAAQVLLMG
jgi:hypothetical protein